MSGTGAYQLGDVTCVYAYFDQEIAPALGNLPDAGLSHLRDEYLRNAMLNEKAMLEIRAWASARSEERSS